MKVRSHKKDKVNIVTLGCSKNLVDSEVMLTQLRANEIDAHHQLEDDNSNVIIVNTCGFIDNAKQESIDTILQYASVKSEGGIDKLYVTGCLSQRYRDELMQEIPEVDAWFGTMELPALLEKFQADYRQELLGERIITTAPHTAYLKISEGCNRTCSFCAIPLMRGGHRSRPMEDLVTEASRLVANGVVEIMLIAQELTYYGLDLYKERMLPELLRQLSDIEGLRWIRLHYAYPSKFPLEVIDVMRERNNICNYLDMPLQHASDSVLHAMRRQITRTETEALVHEIRRRNPEITLRTTMLVGFPGETEEDFEDLLDFVRKMRFNRLGVFTYSHEEGTSGYELEDDVPDDVKQERAAKLMSVQEEIAAEWNQTFVGKELTVLIDRLEGEHFVGRTEGDSPEVDNEVLISVHNQYLRLGDFVQVHITGADAFDLYAEPVQK
ncbi:MAG: 30S ribosomal protein S12 methylthiotransferase RimO [Chitinophagales bacterium]|nr:30S ribosomal protein S12 methylthiotransferase RimO [Chitinophagales bacterium]HAE14797.1 30S ribosomal protein S12 methylthiotransferase RimO [Bacteroidota bacterium]MCB9021695.1 30S ribosomal protein S12 methylthiotransferase RimO [Chitinophagales bacterium]HAE34558.1 30S ribosomal protein S12 methylthiotransferase RimO [Bacteroidota bacterium]HQU38629.1 30S ribosomal protein S12 methylthiotransferase RimO [Chitinophagales bacterium]